MAVGGLAGTKGGGRGLCLSQEDGAPATQRALPCPARGGALSCEAAVPRGSAAVPPARPSRASRRCSHGELCGLVRLGAEGCPLWGLGRV